MSRGKWLQFNDEQLRILLCIADNVPIPQDDLKELMHTAPGWKPRDYELLTQSDITKLTGIEKGNLSHSITELVARGILKQQDSRKSKRRGRPGRYLELASHYTIFYVCDELQYRMKGYGQERGELDSVIEKLYHELFQIPYDEETADSDNLENAVLGKYACALTKYAKLGDPSSASNSLKEVSYPMLQYWSWRMQHEAKKVPKLKCKCEGQMDVSFD
ncbi:Uncharacterised protein [uncultured archaeon]|nr:Uncharacterised protein [uncultured archaeon]